jgi:hypothetical protein
MPDIAATDVTYTRDYETFGNNSRRQHGITVAFGDGALTYPAGGVPLTLANLGFHTTVEKFVIEDGANASGIVWKIDKTNLKLRGYEKAATPDTGDVDAALVELDSGTDAPAAQTVKFFVEGW